ncbi:hypothetical protein RHGRI_006523 [Rhododendron griersonianum]|uniref:Strictosidine synthase conserved region domain-containing protein n=2 Tax=Rhododendron griersonianum TaxID=479676 RepID=A0AAV6KTD3_9ERIC|nr:hypothetical protein RHGRI_006523 [Rhododendron griersonianum]KAG5555899.1 hypothetical protein RHGRI_006523 [Rhododendron griersonianum]
MSHFGSNLFLTTFTILLLSALLATDHSKIVSLLSIIYTNKDSYSNHDDKQVIPIVGAVGPESLAFDPHGRGPYTGVSDGRIIKWLENERQWIDFAVTSTQRNHISMIVSGDRTGRLMKYNPQSKETTVLLQNLTFPNGVSLSKDGDFIFVADTTNCRIIKLWLEPSSKSGMVEVFDRLPGFPDNIKRNHRGEFWVGIHAKRGKFLKWVLSFPLVGQALIKLPFDITKVYSYFARWGGNGLAVRLSGNGDVLEALEDESRNGWKAIYRQIGEKYGVEYSEAEILNRYRWAYEQPWGRSRLRYVNDGKPFWQYIVSSSTGCSDTQYFEELYNYYTTEKAWHLCDPDAEKVFKALRTSGVKLAVVSNFDTRLRPLLRALNCDHWFDAVAVSAEVEAEKPNPTIFLKACELLGVKPEDAVHVGDDRRNDIWGARDAGCDAWLWGSDVQSFEEVFFFLVLLSNELCCSEDRSPGLNKDYSSPCNNLSSNFIV